MVEKETIIEFLNRVFNGYVFEIKRNMINKCDILVINNISSKIKINPNINDILNKEIKDENDKKIIASLVKKVTFFIVGV